MLEQFGSCCIDNELWGQIIEELVLSKQRNITLTCHAPSSKSAIDHITVKLHY